MHCISKGQDSKCELNLDMLHPRNEILGTPRHTVRRVVPQHRDRKATTHYRDVTSPYVYIRVKPTCSSRPVGNQLQGSGAACLLVEAPVVLLRCRVLCPSRHSAGRRSVQLGKKNKNKSADVWWARPQRVSRPSNQTHVSPTAGAFEHRALVMHGIIIIASTFRPHFMTYLYAPISTIVSGVL